MDNRMIINLKEGINVNSIPNNSVLLYDATKGNFYVTTLDSLFLKYKQTYEKEILEYKKLCLNMEKKYEDFIKTQKQINEKLIAMVETAVK